MKKFNMTLKSELAAWAKRLQAIIKRAEKYE